MKKITIKFIGMGFLMMIIYQIVLFFISIFFGFESQKEGQIAPAVPLGAVLLQAIIMVVITYIMVKAMKPTTKSESIAMSVSWAAITFLIILVITIANQTTSYFFGNWYNYIPFLAIGVTPAFDDLIEFARK